MNGVFLLEQNAGQNHSTKGGSELYESVTKFKYLGTTQTNQNGVHEEVKKQIKSGECHFVLYMTHCLCIKVKERYIHTYIRTYIHTHTHTHTHTYIHIYIPQILKSHKTIGCGTCRKRTNNKNVTL
jgi:hypothetical protein